jgi:hypothetical protein
MSERRLPAARLIGCDHLLGDAQPVRQLPLRQPRLQPGRKDEAAGERVGLWRRCDTMFILPIALSLFPPHPFVHPNVDPVRGIRGDQAESADSSSNSHTQSRRQQTQRTIRSKSVGLSGGALEFLSAPPGSNSGEGPVPTAVPGRRAITPRLATQIESCELEWLN